MAKQYQLMFDDQTAKAIESIGRDKGLRSGRAWITSLVVKEVEKYQNSAKVFDQTEYVFLMRDGSYRKSQGANPGGAWTAMGYSIDQAKDLMSAYKTVEKARAAGWVPTPESTPGFVAPERNSYVQEETSRAAEMIKEESPADDLPFGS